MDDGFGSTGLYSTSGSVSVCSRGVFFGGTSDSDFKGDSGCDVLLLLSRRDMIALAPVPTAYLEEGLEEGTKTNNLPCHE